MVEVFENYVLQNLYSIGLEFGYRMECAPDQVPNPERECLRLVAVSGSPGASAVADQPYNLMAHDVIGRLLKLNVERETHRNGVYTGGGYTHSLNSYSVMIAAAHMKRLAAEKTALHLA